VKGIKLGITCEWCWRLKVEPRSLLYRVLVVRYCEVGGSIANRGGCGSVWWNNLNSIRGGAGVGVDRWFDDNLTCVVVGWSNLEE